MKFDFSYFLSLFADPAFWKASLTVLELSTASWIVSMVLGFPIALAKMSHTQWIAKPAKAYIWFFSTTVS